jgi:predicted CopG family antitoxin
MLHTIVVAIIIGAFISIMILVVESSTKADERYARLLSMETNIQKISDLLEEFHACNKILLQMRYGIDLDKYYAAYLQEQEVLKLKEEGENKNVHQEETTTTTGRKKRRESIFHRRIG